MNDATITVALVAAGQKEAKDEDHKDAAKDEPTTYEHQCGGDITHYILLARFSSHVWVISLLVQLPAILIGGHDQSGVTKDDVSEDEPTDATEKSYDDVAVETTHQRPPPIGPMIVVRAGPLRARDARTSSIAVRFP